MYIEAPTKQFKKDLKLMTKQSKDLEILKTVINIIKEGNPLPSKYKEHYLTNNYAGCRECHLTPNWLLVYEIDKKANKLYLVRTGSHSDLFKEGLIINVCELNKQLNEILNDVE